jgi:hypothetical protein
LVLFKILRYKIFLVSTINNQITDSKLTLKRNFLSCLNFLILNQRCFDLISLKSVKMFDRFDIQTNSLSFDPIYWEVNKEYKKGKEIIGTLKVVNDTAERC